jgi:nanoRNase/pAp phosphatase (c-di-AMP/oligoRNAs hydrolase)
MSQSVVKQFEKMISKSSHVLILLPENPENDFFCSGLALGHFFSERNIQTTIAFDDPYEQIASLKFLPQPKDTTITHSIAGSRDLILSFDTTHNKILNVRTQEQENKLTIRITPERGMIDSRDFSFVPGAFPYDLIITVGAPDKESMGKLYEEVPDIFYEVPIINIDNKSENEQFGQVNIIHAVASSISEVIGDLFEQIAPRISKECAQSLLTGIISATNSFQDHNTTPHALTLSSKLLSCGADQQVIVKNLYRNQSFSLLQLWGRAMKNLSASNISDAVVVSMITQDDLNRTSGEKHHVHIILKKMKQNYPKGKIFVLIYEKDVHQYTALIDSQKSSISLVHNAPEPQVIADYIYEFDLLAHTKEVAQKEVNDLLQPYTDQLKKR